MTMVRIGVGTAVVVLAGLFAFHYVTAPGAASQAEKAKSAAREVGDVMVDSGLGAVVQTRLTTTLGLDATRFLHVHYNSGDVVIYGLLPAGVPSEQVAAEVSQIPGVQSVEVLCLPCPPDLQPVGTGAKRDQVPF